MNRPYVICHILSSLDGRINGPFMAQETARSLGSEYGKIRTGMNADAWLLKGDPKHMLSAAAVLSARRAGTTAAFDQLNKYFTIQEMPIVSSRYWNMVHGATVDEVKQDAEGLYTMRVLGRNMAYLLRCQEAARRAGVELPQRETPVFTNFIR